MSAKLQYQCDGCDVVKLVATDKRPDGWGVVTVRICGLSNPYVAIKEFNGEHNYDLCASCQQTLANGSNPTFWPRCKAEGS